MIMIKNRANKVKANLERGAVSCGFYIQMNNPESVEIAGAVGADYVVIDGQHGSFSLESVTSMIRAAEAAGVSPIVRVPDHRPSGIMSALDAGAMGVLVPDVATAEQAKAVVSAARYRDGDNGGSRGACPSTRAAWHQTADWGGFVRWANAEISVWVIIESLAGVENIEAIAAVPGVDALILGTFDLSHEMGLFGQRQHEFIERAFDRAIAACKANGVQAVRSVRAVTPEDIKTERVFFERQGVSIFHLGGDRRLMVNAMQGRMRSFGG